MGGGRIENNNTSVIDKPEILNEIHLPDTNYILVTLIY